MGKSQSEKNPFNFALYISFFPQIMSGPIARYNDFKDDLVRRKFDINELSYGIERFICGLGKKLILSNTFAIVADKAFGSVGSSELTVCLSWLGSICYTMQIYFDFSGYSDMAIGIGNMIGFRCKENFDYPYISKTGTEFWRRWHISLSSWFRDYVYFPLGGSRVEKKFRLFMNLSAVWILTGIWHGANWTFIVWGIFWLIIQIIEKFALHPEKFTHAYSKAIYRFITLLFINFGWVVFRAEDINKAAAYIGTMLGWNHAALVNPLDIFLFRDNFVVLLIGIVLSTPIMTIICEKRHDNLVFRAVEAVALTGLLLVCISYSISVTYNPFIYFDF
ncbi:MAG: MBOAT family protein [Lachnospiraceae bacterium]|nr:MBOAT family protein [Lachnospiraceae bacterium]